MAFQPRTRATIRDALLASWSSRYSAIGLQLLTIPGSDAYILADGLATSALELFEFQALSQTKSPFPDTADSDSLVHHGQVDGVARKAASPATHKITITGTASQTITFGTSVLTYNGISYGNFTNGTTGAPITSVSLDGGGNTTIPVDMQALSPGANTTLPDGTVLTWSSTPTNASSTATIPSNGTVIAGLDAELDLAYALRIIDRRQNRPASGNRSDWQNWIASYTGVVDVYVYPLLQPPGSFPGAGTPSVLGCVTVLALGAAPGDTAGNPLLNRVIGGTAGGSLSSIGSAPNIGAYIEGNASNGAIGAVASGVQLRPVTMAVGDYSIEAVNTALQNVDIQCTMSAAFAFPWTYNSLYFVLSSPTTTSFKISGDQTSVVKPGGSIKPVLVNIGTSNYRGGYYFVTPTAITFDGTNTVFTVPTLPATPVVASVVLPAPSNFSGIRTAIFGLFDTLGPGDVSPAARWPTEETKGRSILYLPAITSRIVQELDAFGTLLSGVRGVLNAVMVTPSSTVTPAAKTILVLGTLTIRTT